MPWVAPVCKTGTVTQGIFFQQRNPPPCRAYWSWYGLLPRVFLTRFFYCHECTDVFRMECYREFFYCHECTNVFRMFCCRECFVATNARMFFEDRNIDWGSHKSRHKFIRDWILIRPPFAHSWLLFECVSPLYSPSIRAFVAIYLTRQPSNSAFVAT